MLTNIIISYFCLSQLLPYNGLNWQWHKLAYSRSSFGPIHSRRAFCWWRGRQRSFKCHWEVAGERSYFIFKLAHWAHFERFGCASEVIDCLQQVFVVTKVSDSVRAWLSVQRNIPNNGNFGSAQKAIVPCPNEPDNQVSVCNQWLLINIKATGLPVHLNNFLFRVFNMFF